MSTSKVSIIALATLTLAGVGCAHNQAAPTSDVAEAPSDNAGAQTKQKPQLAATADNSVNVDLKNALNESQEHQGVLRVQRRHADRRGPRQASEDGDILVKNPTLKIMIAGNCDERGTEEYNLALGERRADSAKRYLTNLGVQDSQLQTVSYGKERPIDDGHNENAWKQNRRDNVAAQTN